MPTKSAGYRMNRRQRVLRRLHSSLATIEDLALLSGCASLFLIMVIKAVDVTLRYCFNFPLQWSYGLISHYLLVAAFFLAMPYTYRVGGHVNVDVVVRSVARPLQAAFGMLTLFLSLLLFGVIFYEGLISTVHSWRGTEIMPDFYNWSSWTSNVFAPIGIFLVEFRIALNLAARLLNIADEPDEPQDSPFFLPRK